MKEPAWLGPPAGVCAICAHRRAVGNRRGSLFLLCRLSEEDPRYPRYPLLPVPDCPGFCREGDG